MASSDTRYDFNENAQNYAWTHVGKHRGKKTRLHQLKPPPPDRQITIAQLNTDFKNKSAVWKNSSCRKKLVTTLDRLSPEGGWGITKAVALALGSFSRENLDLRKRSMFQLAAFLDVFRTVQGLDENEPVKGMLFAQDPMFTERDVEFLSEVGFRVLVNDKTNADTMSHVKEHLGQDCMIFEAFLDPSLERMKVLLNPDTRLYFRSPLENPAAERDSAELRSPEAVRLKDDFKACHDFYQFPVFEEDPTIFAELRIYYGKESDDDEP